MDDEFDIDDESRPTDERINAAERRFDDEFLKAIDANNKGNVIKISNIKDRNDFLDKTRGIIDNLVLVTSLARVDEDEVTSSGIKILAMTKNQAFRDLVAEHLESHLETKISNICDNCSYQGSGYMKTGGDACYMHIDDNDNELVLAKCAGEAIAAFGLDINVVIVDESDDYVENKLLRLTGSEYGNLVTELDKLRKDRAENQVSRKTPVLSTPAEESTATATQPEMTISATSTEDIKVSTITPSEVKKSANGVSVPTKSSAGASTTGRKGSVNSNNQGQQSRKGKGKGKRKQQNETASKKVKGNKTK